MQAVLAELQKQNAEQAAQIQALLQRLDALLNENKLLNRKVQFLMQRLFGRKSEKLDRNQLELLLGVLDAPPPDDDDPPPSSPRPRGPRRESKPRLPADLPVEEQIVDPEPVRQDPSGYVCIGQEVTEELDVVPTRYFRRRIVRRKFRSKANRDCPPLIAPLAPRLIEGSYASAGLVADILVRKYVDHLPLHRQEQILRTRHGIELSRKTMCDWVRVAADWLKPIYTHIREDLRGGAYLQVDETPVRFCQEGSVGSGQGYLWVYHRPGGDVLYEWHTSRAASCLEEMLDRFRGTVQCDGYSAYTSYARGRDDLTLAACWAHARRKFHEARAECPGQVGWVLRQIRLLYGIEQQLRGRGPQLRQAVRGAQSTMILARLERWLRLKLDRHRPTSAMGSAISYTLSLWPQLLRYRDDGRLEIDNNLVENAIRPTALGKKNWLFIGHPEAGERSAILYTLLENCRRRGINPLEYLHDVLSRLPAMTNRQTRSLTPANWLAERRAAQVA
jgi:transposase